MTWNLYVLVATFFIAGLGTLLWISYWLIVTEKEYLAGGVVLFLFLGFSIGLIPLLF